MSSWIEQTTRDDDGQIRVVRWCGICGGSSARDVAWAGPLPRTDRAFLVSVCAGCNPPSTPLALVSAFLAVELTLPDRHHGPKGRTTALVSALQNAEVPVSALVIRDGIEWAFSSVLLAIMTRDQAAAWLVASWFAV